VFEKPTDQISVGEIAATPNSSLTVEASGLATWVKSVLQFELVCGRYGPAGPLPRASKDRALLRSGIGGPPGLVPARVAAAVGVTPPIATAEMTAATTRHQRTRFPSM
jgi:hypothetical protein